MGLLTDTPPPDRLRHKGIWRLRVDAVPPSGNVLKRMHWRLYENLIKKWFLLIRAAEGFLKVSKPTGKRWILMIRHAHRMIDKDNRYFATKPIVDVLRPAKHTSGIFKTGKRAGQPWSRDQLGHGLIREDNDANVETMVVCRLIPRNQKPFTEIIISDIPITHEDF
jgi:hypothetical protein